jgi:hypothetical protein
MQQPETSLARSAGKLKLSFPRHDDEWLRPHRWLVDEIGRYGAYVVKVFLDLDASVHELWRQ